ncbi:MAG: NYN domain-containing protein [Elusimicrobia bacterium]|nr:NYN domain-containing protein [Elusimicrobiota bacterium]
MNRIAFFVDGFNVYHALQEEPAYIKYKWLDLIKLAKCFVGRNDTLTKVFYFTAYATWDADKVARHQMYVKALQGVGAEVTLGMFKYKQKRCRNCHKLYETYEEKETDVNIATMLLKTAVQDLYDSAVIVSGDSDLIPAVKAVKSLFPAKKIGVMVPIGRSAEDLKKNCDFRFKMKERHLQTSQFPDIIDLGEGAKLERPKTWA